jgi:hypothetical protein
MSTKNQVQAAVETVAVQAGFEVIVPSTLKEINIPAGAVERMRDVKAKDASGKRVSTGVTVPTGRYVARGTGSILGVDYSEAKALGVSNKQIERAKEDATFRAILAANIVLLRATQQGQVEVSAEFNRNGTVIRLTNEAEKEKAKLVRGFAASVTWTAEQLKAMRAASEAADKAKAAAVQAAADKAKAAAPVK